MVGIFRRSFVLAAVVVCMAGFASTAGAEAIKVVDEGGYEASFDKPVTRIVALNRYNTEFVRAVAGSKAVVGLDRDAWIDRDYWPEIDESHVVAANQGEIDYESIVAQQPELVIIPRNGAWQEAREKLAPFHIPVVVLTIWWLLRRLHRRVFKD